MELLVCKQIVKELFIVNLLVFLIQYTKSYSITYCTKLMWWQNMSPSFCTLVHKLINPPYLDLHNVKIVINFLLFYVGRNINGFCFISCTLVVGIGENMRNYKSIRTDIWNYDAYFHLFYSALFILYILDQAKCQDIWTWNLNFTTVAPSSVSCIYNWREVDKNVLM
jgi:hypothetical protein